MSPDHEEIGPQDIQQQLDELADQSIAEHLLRVQAALDGAEAAGDTERAARLIAEREKWERIRQGPPQR